MSATSEQIIEYAAKGMQQVQISRMLGVEESYVSQVVNTEEAQERIQARAAQISEVNAKFDTEAEEAEMTALQSVKRRLPTANFQQSLQALRVLNALNKRRDTSPATRQVQGTVQTLTLPQQFVTQFVINSQSQIVEVGGRTMVSASAGQLPALAQAKLNRIAGTEEVPALSQPKVERTDELLNTLEYRPSKRKSAAELDLSDIL